MNFIFFVFLYLLGPEISSARKYLIIDLDELSKLELRPHGARRQSDTKIHVPQPRDFLKTAINILQTYDEDQLDDVFNSFKKELANLNIDDTNFSKAKEFVLNFLVKVKSLMNVGSQRLDNDSPSDASPSLRTIENGQKVGRLLDNFYNDIEPKRNRAWMPQGSIFDSIKSALRLVAHFILPRELTWTEELTPEEKDILSKLANVLQEQNGSIFDSIKSALRLVAHFILPRELTWTEELTPEEKDILSKLANVLQEQNGNEPTTEKSDWNNDLLNTFTDKLKNPNENEGHTDWKNLLSMFLKDSKQNDAISFLKDMAKKLASNEMAWKMLQKLFHEKPSERGTGVNLSL